MKTQLRPLMIVGCTSSAGKSLVVTALARWFARQGVDVVPFKAQNMSNNARVVPGGEIGVAQWLQALAARVPPTVAMNPVLLKPEADTQSQVVVNGIVRHDLTAMPWRDRGEHLWPAMTGAFDSVKAAHELVLIEGAGSPAEINLQDLVNNGMMEYADAAGLLVVDIDRGGSFAHLFGTWSLTQASTRERLAGFLLNKFRGDPSLLEPGPSMVRDMTGMQFGGNLPMLAHELPDEEGATTRASHGAGGPVVGIVRYPFASNLDEFHVLGHAAEVRWVLSPRDLERCDLVILPGSKHVSADLGWLRDRALDQALVARAGDQRSIIGICGGCMMLGSDIIDHSSVEGSAHGLGILPLRTTFDPIKVTRPATVRFPSMPGPFSKLGGVLSSGYEIRNGRISGEACELSPLLWGKGSVLSTTVHGLLENPQVLGALCGREPEPVLENTFEALADAVDEHLDTVFLRTLVGLAPSP